MRSPFLPVHGVDIRAASGTHRVLVRSNRMRVPVAVLAAITLASSALAAPPSNDNFANATSIAAAGETLMGTNVEATVETGEPLHDGKQGGHSVWWKWTASSVAAITVSTVGSDFDTLLGIYTGTDVGALTLVTSNDDTGLAVGPSEASFAATPGTTYMIAVDGYSGDVGSITIQLTVGGPPPVNDAFAAATVVPTGGGTLVGDTTNATKEPNEGDHAQNEGGRSIWWAWTPSQSGNATIDTAGSDFDTLLSVYQGSTLASLVTVDENDDDNSTGTTLKTSSVTISVVNGTTYHIAVDGWGGDYGSVQLNVAFTEAAGPANDNFINAATFPAIGGTVNASSDLATIEPGEPLHAGKLGGRSVWWNFTPSAAGPVSVDTSGSAFDTLLAVYTGTAVDGLTEVASNDDNGINTTSYLTFDASAGTTYRIAVDGYQGQSGNVTLTVIPVIAPPGPVVAIAASAIDSTSFVANWNLVTGATGYRIDVSTSSDFSTYLAGYQDLDVGNVSNRSIAGLTANVTYYYRVRAYNTAGSGPSSNYVSAATTTASFQGLTNMSVLASAGGGNDTLILGFAIVGTGNKTLIIRGVGPKLVKYGVSNPVENPSIVLYHGQDIVNQNDDWSTALAGDFVTVGAFALDPGSNDAAMKVDLPAGGYTVHLINPGNPAEGLIEVYDESKGSTSRLVNLSCRLNINPGQTIIAGAYLENETKPLLIRSVGPSLSQWVTNYLPDPDLRVYVGSTEVGYDDDWDVALRTYFGPAGAFDLVDGSADAVLRPTISPGTFTVHTTGKSGTGVTLLEIYDPTN